MTYDQIIHMPDEQRKIWLRHDLTLQALGHGVVRWNPSGNAQTIEEAIEAGKRLRAFVSAAMGETP